MRFTVKSLVRKNRFDDGGFESNELSWFTRYSITPEYS